MRVEVAGSIAIASGFFFNQNQLWEDRDDDVDDVAKQLQQQQQLCDDDVICVCLI